MQKLITAINTPVLFDASVLLVGIEKQAGDLNYSFENMQAAYLDAVLNEFKCILIHQQVWEELSEDRQNYISPQIGKNVEIVKEGKLYGNDPLYTTMFNQIADHDLFRYQRLQSKDKGDVFTLAYAVYYGIPFVSTRDGSMLAAIEELSSLDSVSVIGFEDLLVLGYINTKSKDVEKRLAALYKRYCTPAIKKQLIPSTFKKYLEICRRK